jgi:hypothetical protein
MPSKILTKIIKSFSIFSRKYYSILQNILHNFSASFSPSLLMLSRINSPSIISEYLSKLRIALRLTMRQRQRAKNILIFLEAINDAEGKEHNMSYINCLEGSAKNSENELLEMFILRRKLGRCKEKKPILNCVHVINKTKHKLWSHSEEFFKSAQGDFRYFSRFRVVQDYFRYVVAVWILRRFLSMLIKGRNKTRTAKDIKYRAKIKIESLPPFFHFPSKGSKGFCRMRKSSCVI